MKPRVIQSYAYGGWCLEFAGGLKAPMPDEATARRMAESQNLLECLIEMASGHSMAGEARAREVIARATEGTP